MKLVYVIMSSFADHEAVNSKDLPQPMSEWHERTLKTLAWHNYNTSIIVE